MPDHMDVEPEELRKLAEQHNQAAGNIRKWGEIPETWLADFEQTYGSLADPVRAALVDYYNRRHTRAERLAGNHERTRDELLASADTLEEADHNGNRHITQAGDDVSDASPAGPKPDAPTDPARPVTNEPSMPREPSATPPNSPDTAETRHTPNTPELHAEAGRPDQPPLPPTAPTPQTGQTTGPAGFIPSLGALPTSDAAEPGAPHPPAAPAVDKDSAAGVTDGTTSTPPPADPFPVTVPPGVTGSASLFPSSPLTPASAPTAAHTSRGRRELASFVVGEPLDDDLALARALLAAVLAAVSDSARGLEWATAVLRTARGPIALLTSTEGRGWLPSGLFLPRAVTLPWKWEHILDAAERDTVSALEGSTDPARILTEFGLMALRHRPLRISALASSTTVSDSLRIALGAEVPVQDQISPTESTIDLASPGRRLVDRLAMAGPKRLRQQATTTPDSDIRAICLELAKAADAQIRSTVFATDAESTANHDQRKRILDALHAGRAVPASWWEEFNAIDRTQAELLESQRVDLSSAPVGTYVDVPGAENPRTRVFERRANELLVLAGAEPHRQTLRDAFYSYGQIVEHPSVATAGRVALQQTAGSAPMSVRVPREAGHPAIGSDSVSVASNGFHETPPSVAELLQGPSVSKGSGEQRKV